MSIHKTIEYSLIFTAIGMFGGGGILAIEIVSGDILIESIFAIPTIIGLVGLLFNSKKIGIADKKIKEMEK